jgi:hypothetical protein
MTNVVRRMVRDGFEGALLGGSIGGGALWLMGTLLAGLEPLVFLACGVYAGTVYGGIVGALLGARDSRLDIEELDSAPLRAA